MPEKNHQKIIVVSVMKFVWYLLQYWIQGGPVIQTLRKGRGGLQENFFGPFGPQFGLKIRGGRAPLGPSPGSATVLQLTTGTFFVLHYLMSIDPKLEIGINQI